jgi:hypothetical protein
MSYYRFTTSVYKSYLPELNRTLRSSSIPRTVPDLDKSELTEKLTEKLLQKLTQETAPIAEI